jgi:hypothetical protein
MTTISLSLAHAGIYMMFSNPYAQRQQCLKAFGWRLPVATAICLPASWVRLTVWWLGLRSGKEDLK